jgi:hypothetical protein
MDQTLRAILRENARLEEVVRQLRRELQLKRATIVTMGRELDDYRRRSTYRYNITFQDANGVAIDQADLERWVQATRRPDDDPV